MLFSKPDLYGFKILTTISVNKSIDKKKMGLA